MHRSYMTVIVLGQCLLGLSLGSNLAAADDAGPQDLRRTATVLREIAGRLEYGGRAGRAEAFQEQADLAIRQAEFQEQLARAERRIEAAEKVDDTKAVERYRISAENLRMQVLEMQAQRVENQRLSEEKDRNREKLRQLAFRAASLRDEHRFEDADDVDEEIRAILTSSTYDPELRRVNALKMQAVEWQVDGRYEDAMLLQAEANRLLENVKRRVNYLAEDEQRVELLNRAADLLTVGGEENTAIRVYERIEQMQRESRSEERDQAAEPRADAPLKQLREDVDRLSHRVEELARAIEALLARDEP